MLRGRRDFLNQISGELPNEYKARKCHEREVSQAKRRGHQMGFLQLVEAQATEEGNRRTYFGDIKIRHCPLMRT